jgi:hypothetical protein
MRVTLLGVALVVGCGPVRLGEERGRLDAGSSGVVDASVAQLGVLVTVSPSARCDGCATLTAQAEGGTPPYRFAWDDGSRGERREVCVQDGPGPFTVQVQDADGMLATPHATRLELGALGCAPDAAVAAPLLCLQNGSFEGKPAVNTGVPTNFDALPWSVCTNPSQANTPDLVNETIPQMFVSVPSPSDGATYLGMAEGEQTSQALCRPVLAATSLSFELDLSRIYLGGGVVPDSEATFLEVWGGIGADCSQHERLWVSPKLDFGWTTYCVTLRPQQYMDSLTLRARSDESLPSQVYLVADHLVPVDRCP